ncbi:hypothetical protein Tco_1468018 [Tanacetum coccineum]
MPRECLKIIESKSKVRQSRSKAVVAKVSTSSSTPAVSPDVAELKDTGLQNIDSRKKNQTPAPVKADSCTVFHKKCANSRPNHAKSIDQFDGYAFQEDLKGITTRSGVAYQGPTIPPTSSSSPKVMNRDTEVTKDTMLPTNNGSTEDVQSR